jgi:asparagine synthase (glutamine-hydrolysing)
MCGIGGSTGAERSTLLAMTARLRHRGPDGEGIWQEAERGPGLVHTRLAVIDLTSDGAQPMASADGRYVLGFNGEIYNYRVLRASLEREGERFRTASDTEVLLRLLERRGTAALDELVGMFAFALWDRERRELLIARDRLGIKPLLYAHLPGGGLAFASEIDALAVHPGIDLGLDRAALSDYLACLYVPAPATFHHGIRKLPPGHWLRWRDGAIETGAWWRPRFAGDRAGLSVDEAAEELLPLLRQAVGDCMVADVPVGCFLSGGIDSSVIAALMAEELKRRGAPPLRSFTMSFAERTYDESAAAREIAEAIGSRHTELPASPAADGDAAHRILEHFGEPFGNPTALLIDDLSRKAREHVTVALVGDGGDEVFAGYPRYQGGLLAQRYRRLPAWLRGGVIAPLSDLIPESSAGRHGLRRAREFLAAAGSDDATMYAAWVEYFSPEERAALLGEDIAAVASPIRKAYEATGAAAPLDAMQLTDLETFLPGNLLFYGDAMSMGHALELRLPLLDHRLIDAVGRYAPGLRFAHGKKTLLRAVARRLLPARIVERPKRGFNPPMGLWLQRELRPLVERHLRPERLARLGLAWAPVRRLLDEQRAGRRDHALKIWSLIVLDAWQESRKAQGLAA